MQKPYAAFNLDHGDSFTTILLKSLFLCVPSREEKLESSLWQVRIIVYKVDKYLIMWQLLCDKIFFKLKKTALV